MRTIGVFIVTLILFPSFQLQKTMENENNPADQQKNVFRFQIPPDKYPSFITGSKKKADIDTNNLKQSSWYSNAIKQIEESEYAIKPVDKSNEFASPNRQQDLRTSYTSDKFTLEPRADDHWKLQLTLKGVYSGKNKIYSPQQDAIAVTEKNKIQFNHNNEFIVEYINSKEGVRQNFIVQKKPMDLSSKLSIHLSANKNWYINKVHDKELHFAKQESDHLSKKITYNRLKVWDANNKELTARFTVNETHTAFEIEVNTDEAVFPITIDPLSTTPNSILDDCNQADANFGISVASAGDVNGDGYSDVIIGAYSFDDGGNIDEGKAFVYHGSATGLSATPNSTPDDADLAGANFGNSVSSAGDVNRDGYSDVIIGAVAYNDGASSFEGRAYIYHGSSTGLSTTPDRTLDDANQANAFFGRMVACAGDVNGDGFSDVVIGADGYDEVASADEGWAFVHYGSFAGVSLSPNTILDDADQAFAYFGISVAGAGDVNGDGYSDVIVGADVYDEPGFNNEGRAFVYYGSAGGLSPTPDWVGDDANQAGALFGCSVASAGDVNGDGYSDVIIGACTYIDGGNTNEGRAFVYYGSVSGLSISPNSTPDDANQANAFFGVSVACAGDVNGDGYSDIIVGAFAYDDGANGDEGRAFIYLGSATGLSATPNDIPDDADQANAQFGISVSSAGDVNGDGYSDVIIGANGYDDSPNTDEGFAFIYHGSPDGLNTSSSWSFESNQAGAQLSFITGATSAGDINADGYSDVIIGVPFYSNVESSEGRAYAFYGSASGLSASPDWTAEINQAGASFGISVSFAGDVNGDGYGDVLIGANQYSNSESQEGRVYGYYGSSSGLPASPNWNAESNQATAWFGFSVAGAGDVNGDGYGDVIIGAFLYDNTLTDEGASFVYYGSNTGLASSPAWSGFGGQASCQYGFSVGSAGDVNGDGFSDVIVGAETYSSGQVNEGKAFAYYGSATGLSVTANWTGEPDIASASFGARVAPAGDVNGDGYGDVIIGAFGYANGQTGEGAAFVYHGSSSGLSVSANWIVEGNANSVALSIANNAGDVNGDGYSDVIVGAFGYTNGESGEGAAFVYHGSSTGLSITSNWSVESNQASARMCIVACAGDVNGDGFSDVLVGAYQYSNSESQEGKIYLYYGNKAGGLRNNLRLYNSDLITPIQQSNMADPNLFGAGLYAKSFIGKQKGKLVWQTVKNGNPFTGSPITNSTAFTAQQATFTDLGLTGFELKDQIAKQMPAKATYIRTRVRYDLVTAITGQVYGPWRYPEGFLRGRRDIGAVILPVKFISFTAVKQDKSALLKWITTDEEPGVQFEVQHSANGINFTTITTIHGKNQTQNEYEWLHTNPAKGTNFYRIRAVENQKEGYTATRKLNFSEAVDISIYPNPAVVNQTLIVESVSIRQNQPLKISFTNSAGQIVWQKEMPAVADGKVTLNVPGLPAGAYFLLVQAGQWTGNEKIVIVAR